MVTPDRVDFGLKQHWKNKRLKGFAAATLYGTAGKNGVILLQQSGFQQNRT
jgi:hypothetical protein